MRAASTLSLVTALFSLALALPQGPELTTRQSIGDERGNFRIGDPSTGFGSGSGRICNPLILEQTGFCVIGGDLLPPRGIELGEPQQQRRQVHIDDVLSATDEAQIKKDAIKRIQLELQELHAKKRLSPAEKAHVHALKFLLKELAGIVSQVPPSGGSTILIPGRRLGRRQLTGPVRCEMLDELNRYSDEIAAFLAQFPPIDRNRIWSLLITEIITQCRLSQVGPIRPDPGQPGAPIRPDPTKPGSPLRPDPLQPGAPIRPDPTQPGAPLRPPRKV